MGSSPRTGAGVCGTAGSQAAAFSGNGRMDHLINEVGRFAPAEAVVNELAAADAVLAKLLKERLNCRMEILPQAACRLEGARKTVERQFGAEAVGRLLSEVRFAVIRGNASEIRAIALGERGGSGVDVSAGDAITEDSLPAAAELTQSLSRCTGAVIAMSGAVDVLSDGGRTIFLRNGVDTMAHITGSGCMLTALTGAFCGASPAAPFEAAAVALAVMGVAGELAEKRRLRNGTGNATFRNDLIDAVFNLTEDQLTQGVRYEIYKG